MTGARVFVRKEPRMVAGTPERCVVVRGTLAQVEAAERMLAELLLEAARNGQLPANPNPNPNPNPNRARLSGGTNPDPGPNPNQASYPPTEKAPPSDRACCKCSCCCPRPPHAPRLTATVPASKRYGRARAGRAARSST